jgi:predicted nucleotidyltransferase
MIASQALADRVARRPKWAGTVDEAVIQEVVRRIVEAVAPEKIILFGSAARGQMGPDSDLDLLVVKACENRREVSQAISRTLRGVGGPKDVVVVTPEDVEEQKDIPGMVVRAALREGRVLYAA